MSVPKQLVGAWRRSGLFIHDVRRADFCDVLWLQTPTWFIDIRLRLDADVEPADAPGRRMARTVAMGGIAEWSDPMMSWRPTFGSRVDDDVAEPEAYRLDWRDNVVVEQGSITVEDETFTFAEEWLRMSAVSDEPAVAVREQYLFIAIGRWSIEVCAPPGADRLRAVRRDQVGGRLVEIGSVDLM